MQDLTRLREREHTLFSLHRLEYDLKVIGLMQKLNLLSGLGKILSL